MITNPNLVTPASAPFKVVQLAVLRALDPLLYTYTDELGNPVQLVLRDTAAKEWTGFPNITIKVEGGEITETNGHNLVTESDDATIRFYEVTYWGALVKVSLESRLALERERLMDFLLGGMHSFSVLDQFSLNPSVIAEAVQTSLAANGVWVRSTQDISMPDPIPDEARPSDTLYKASFTWRCDVSLQYSLAGTPVTQIAIAATLSAGSQSRTTNMVAQ